MKRIFFIIAASLTLYACKDNQEIKDESTPLACISGIIYKYNTGNSTNALVELVKDGVIVHAEEIGQDGSYEIKDIKEGTYIFQVHKLGFDNIDEDFGTHPISITFLPGGRCVRQDYPISKIPPTLNVVEINDPEKTKSVLTFSESKIEDHFRIYNNSSQTLTWHIDWEAEQTDCKWLKSISCTSDTIKPGEGTNVIIRIDPARLNGGEEQTAIYIDGGKESGGWILTLKASSPANSILFTHNVRSEEITYTEASLHATVTDAGYPPSNRRGFEVSIAPDFSMIVSLAEENPLTDANEFSCIVSQLKPGIHYYARAFATNNIKTVYSTEKTPINFTTKASPPEIVLTKTLDGITATAEIVEAGIPAYHHKGFCYSTNPIPTINDKTIFVDGTAIGLFQGDLNVADLEPNKLYRIRAFAVSDYDTTYSETILYSTDEPRFYDQVLVYSDTHSAELSGYIFFKGNPPYYERGFEWYPVYAPELKQSIRFQETELAQLESGAELKIEITGLLSGTTYQVREFATNALDTFYGNWTSFTTLHSSIL